VSQIGFLVNGQVLSIFLLNRLPIIKLRTSAKKLATKVITKTVSKLKSADADMPDITASKTTPGMKIPMIAKDSIKAVKNSPHATHYGFC